MCTKQHSLPVEPLQLHEFKSRQSSKVAKGSAQAPVDVRLLPGYNGLKYKRTTLMETGKQVSGCRELAAAASQFRT
jgi:hypothetical protein